MSPYLLLFILVGIIYGAIFHIWQGKGVKDLLYYIPASLIGFGLGQAIANFLGWQWFMIGPLHIVEATICSWLVLLIARWLRG